jgi:serine/threonine protein phosphatase PrpC
MKCPSCGAKNREDARFCRSCGRNLAEPAAVDVEPAAEATEVPGEEQPSVPEPAEAPPEEPEPAALAEAPPEAPTEEPPVAPLPQVPPESTVEPETEVEAGPEIETEARAAQIEGEPAAEAEEPPPTPAPAATEAEPGPEAAPSPDTEGEVLAFWREDVEPLVPAEPGTVVADRYLLVEAQDVQDDEIQYLARDLQKCWQCGFEDNAPDEAFCARCGASLDRKPQIHLVEVAGPDAEPSTGEPVKARLEFEGRYFVVTVEPAPEPGASQPPPGIRLVVGQRSHPGQVRELDEDSLLALTLAPTYVSQTGPVLGLFAVADGMGGHEGGEVASKLALQVLVEQVLHTIILPELAGEPPPEAETLDGLRRAAMAANDAVYLARQKAGNDMGTTLTTLYLRDDRLFVAHVGDSRAYRWNASGLEQLTTDHSVVASMIASGQAAPDEIYTHPHRSVIYRSIGDKATVEVDTDLLPLATGDRLVLCCDGVWETIRTEGIADALMQEADPQLACDLMVDRANLAGGEDNISVIVVQVEAM